MFDEQMTVIEQVGDLLLDPLLAFGRLLCCHRWPAPVQLGHRGLQLLTRLGHGAKHGLGQFFDDVEFADLVSNLVAEHLGNRHRIQRRSISGDTPQRPATLIQLLLETSEEPNDVFMCRIVVEHLVEKALKVAVVHNREHTERSVVELVRGNVATEVRQGRVQIIRGNMLLSLFSPRPQPSSESWRRGQTRGDPAISARRPPDRASRLPPPGAPPSQLRGEYNGPLATPGHPCRH